VSGADALDDGGRGVAHHAAEADGVDDAVDPALGELHDLGHVQEQQLGRLAGHVRGRWFVLIPAMTAAGLRPPPRVQERSPASPQSDLFTIPARFGQAKASDFQPGSTVRVSQGEPDFDLRRVDPLRPTTESP